MILEDTKKILNVLDATYDILSKDIQDTKKNILLINTWHKILQYYTYENVGRACGNYITNSRIKPKPSDIRQELNAMQAVRHSVHKQLTVDASNCESKVTLSNLKNLCNNEFAPFMNMNLPQDLRMQLIEKHNQNNIDEFVTHIWGYIRDADFSIFHIEMALATVRGTKFNFKDFMKALMSAFSLDEEIRQNPDMIESVKTHLSK